MPRFDCTTAAGVQYAIAQTHRSENTTGLLGLPEAMLNEALSQLRTKYLRRFSFVNRYALTRARARIAQLPDPDWRLGLGDPRSQATVYYRREEQTGAAWLKRYEDSIVIWDASGGARCYPQTAAAAKDKLFCEACVTHMPPPEFGANSMAVRCCGAVLCSRCRGERANCVVCGTHLPLQSNSIVIGLQHLREQLHRRAAKGSVGAQYVLGQHYFYGPGENTEAYSWWERAARQGHAEAQYFMGVCLAWPTSQAPSDYPRMADYMALASAQHLPRAIRNLGRMYFEGDIPTPDAETRYAEAVRLFKLDIQLAQGSETNSYLLLGRCYLRGLGVPANRDYAERLWQHAVIDWEDPEAREELEDAGMDVPSTVVDYFG